MEYFVLTLLACMIFFLLIFWLSLWSAGSISGVYFDNKTRELGKPLLIVFVVGCSDRCARAGCYLLYILCNGNPILKLYFICGRKAYVEDYYECFGRINYRKLARKRDWVMAILLWGSIMICLTSVIILCIASALSGSA